jgi:rare lipoprotein A
MHKFLRILLLCLFSFLIISCSHVRRDGPPNFYVDESKIPNATPKVEPLSKNGNMPVYRVFGKKYYTLRSSKNYVAVGTASWYGTQFHAHSTSSGEPYNMLAMTAAHKTLPLPTYVEVTNLKNNRQIIVKVNDRGPFESNRLIDLSYVAAKKLGMIGHGTATVRVKAIDPATYGKHMDFASSISSKTSNALRSAITAGKNKTVFLQVGAFKSKENALKYKRHLTSLISAPVNVYHPRGRSKLFQVQIGPINDAITATNLVSKLKTYGINASKVYGA